MAYFIVILFFLSLLYIFLFSLGQLHLTWYYLFSRSRATKGPIKNYKELPFVTIQLPVYNELYVVERLLDNIALLNYPQEKLEIQVLDDSTDETVQIIANKVEQLKAQGIDIHHIQRSTRTGFKAGALHHGLNISKGEFIAIFDADFLPDKDFLNKTIHYFTDPEVGVVQTRWGHINKDYSVFTKLQAFALDAHFSIEQTGRNKANSFINFNGTGGIWRKNCIINAGGWSADTLTEDLDLSYRAQLKGWKFTYIEDVIAPAELPVYMPAIKSQQFRWNKGAAETARKNLLNVLKSGHSLSTKLHAFFHLLNSAVFLCLLLSAILSIPMLFVNDRSESFQILSKISSFFLMGFFSITFFYLVATKYTHPNRPFWYFLKIYPLFLIISMGFSLHNAYAVLEGLLGFKSPFIRTPKFNIVNKKDTWNKNIYIKNGFNLLTLAEGVLFLYFSSGVILGVVLKDYNYVIFHLMLSIGFAVVFFNSIIPVTHDRT